jgi:hypothetical protein
VLLVSLLASEPMAVMADAIVSALGRKVDALRPDV